MKTALILGRAKGLFEEIAAAQAMVKFDYVLATGPMVVDYPGEVDCWVWFHTELFKDIAERRARNGHPPVKSYWSVKYKGHVRGGHALHVNYLDWNGGGASGLVATLIALRELKVDRVALAGIPMTPEGGQYDSNKIWKEAKVHRQAWINILPELIGKVRSFSGWTLDLLEDKPPTAAWLRGEPELAVA